MLMIFTFGMVSGVLICGVMAAAGAMARLGSEASGIILPD